MEFSNPLPPTNYQVKPSQDSSQPLTNDDFRKLMMTPRAGGPAPAASTFQKQTSITETKNKASADERKKKKAFYAQLKKMEDEKKKELEGKYRDRAKERRDGKTNEDPQEISTTADYRAVAPDLKTGITQAAERRKQLIEESKYLGGDMEHTHLVKGLDYALLEKVRAEINHKEADDDDLEAAVDEEDVNKIEEVEQPLFRTKIAKNICRVLFQERPPQRNEMFAPGRMAYVVDLEDDFPESDIPTTSIRSKADCPNAPETTTLSTNDIVISKLTQILAYLRQGKRDRKKKKEKEKATEANPNELVKPKDDIDIFGDAYSKDTSNYETRSDRKDGGRGDREDKYKSSSSRHRSDRDRYDRSDRDRSDRDRDRGRDRNREKDRDRHRHSERDRDRDQRREARDIRDDKKRSYFEKPTEEDDYDRITENERKQSTSQFIKGLSKQYDEKHANGAEKNDKESKSSKSGKKRKPEIDSYAECYPGMEEAIDAIDDSDEEADYSKMDMGNKKGPLNRWDFEDEEKYQEYMSQREAMPKAAFQYGVKMSDGRKTRRAGPKDDKAAVDREWQQIQNIWSKSSKKPKY